MASGETIDNEENGPNVFLLLPSRVKSRERIFIKPTLRLIISLDFCNICPSKTPNRKFKV